MPYQNDMMSLADIVSPAYAAQQAGIQNDAANQEEQAKATVAQATIPADIQKPFLANLFTGAQTAAEQGVAQQQQAAGTEALATMGGKIGAANAGNQVKITNAHVEQLGQLGQIVGGIADQIQNVPGPARPAMMGQILDGFNITDPSIRQMVASGDPDQLRQLSQGLFQASNAARTELMKNQTQLGVAQIDVAGREQVAKEQADARRYVADQKAQVDRLKQNTDQALAQIVARLGTPQEQPQDRAQAQFLQQHAEQLRQMQALTTQQLLGMPVPSPDLSTIPQGGGAPAGGQPGQQAPGNLDMNAMAEELRRRGALK